MKTFAAGKLRKRLVIQRNTAKDSPETRDSYGQQRNDGWTTVATVWGSIEPLSGNEAFVAQQLLPQASHRIRIRFTPTFVVGASYRVQYGSRTFHIAPPLNTEERNIELVIAAVETTNLT